MTKKESPGVETGQVDGATVCGLDAGLGGLGDNDVEYCQAPVIVGDGARLRERKVAHGEVDQDDDIQDGEEQEHHGDSLRETQQGGKAPACGAPEPIP
jgi:hypothetical protein